MYSNFTLLLVEFPLLNVAIITIKLYYVLPKLSTDLDVIESGKNSDIDSLKCHW